MNTILFSAIILIGSIFAGFFGALTGLGGGAFVVPLLTIVLGVDIKYAIGASLISIIATSSGAAAAYVKKGFVNLRLAMLLGIPTTLGAIAGAFLAMIVPANLLSVIFGAVLIISAYLSIQIRDLPPEQQKIDPLAERLELSGSYPAIKGIVVYKVRNVPGGSLIMLIAGILSGLLGVGSGAIKVLALDQVMRVPFKVSTATSNLMIGVTAATSSGLYFSRGYVDPGLSMPVMLGVLVGAFFGAKLMPKLKTNMLRWIFSLIVFFIATQMIFNGWTGL